MKPRPARFVREGVTAESQSRLLVGFASLRVSIVGGLYPFVIFFAPILLSIVWTLLRSNFDELSVGSSVLSVVLVMMIIALAFFGYGGKRQVRLDRSLLIFIICQWLVYLLTLWDIFESGSTPSEFAIVLVIVPLLAFVRPPARRDMRSAVQILTACLACMLTLWIVSVVAAVYMFSSTIELKIFSLRVIWPELDSLAVRFENLNLAFLGLFLVLYGLWSERSRGRIPYVLVGLALIASSSSRSVMLICIAVIATWGSRGLLRLSGIRPRRLLASSTGIAVMLLCIAWTSGVVFSPGAPQIPAASASHQGQASEIEEVANQNDLDSTGKAGVLESALNGRTDIWRLHALAVVEEPLEPFGKGTSGINANVARLMDEYGLPERQDYVSAHNLYLDTWHRFGLIGLLVFGSVAGLALSASWRFRKASGDSFPLAVIGCLLALGITEQALAWYEVSAAVLLLNFAVFWCSAPSKSADVPTAKCPPCRGHSLAEPGTSDSLA